MENSREYKLIERLCSANSPSGFESEAAEYVRQELEQMGLCANFDRMGNLILHKSFGKGERRKRVMVSAHLDEVGFMITEIRDNGYLGFDTVGGISGAVMAGRRVRVLGDNGTLDGVIASKAIHHKDKDERKNMPSAEKLYIDIGASNGEDACARVKVGDFAVFASETYAFGDGLIKAKALDDRMGCAAMIECIAELEKNPSMANIDVYFCFTVREEIGLSGARVAAFEIRPDIAIVLETTAVADIADVPSAQRVAELGGGVAVSVMDRSTIYDKEMTELCLSTAEQCGIPAQTKKYVSGGNDAGSIHKTADGVKVAALSVPTRYLHSAACVASMSDYRAQRDLLCAILRRL